MKKILTALSIVLGVVLSGASVTYATLRVVQTPTYHLYIGESGTATTMRITPFPVDLDGTKLTITDFGTTPTVTVDPKVSGIEEIESFTGITDNGDNTATLTGLSRDLVSKYPYTTAGTGRTHGSGATVVFGNNPQIYGRLAAPENIQTWTAIQTYSSSTMPRFDAEPSAAMYAAMTGLEFVDLNKLNSYFVAGAANSSETANGISQLATGAQAASSTRLGSTGARNVLPASLATSSPGNNATTTIPVTEGAGKLNQGFFDLTKVFTFSGGLWSSASSTFACANLTTLTCNFNGLSTQFPSTRGSSSSVMTTDGAGKLYYIAPGVQVISIQTLALTTLNTSTTSLATVVVPLNALNNSKILKISGTYTNTGGGVAACNHVLIVGTGAASTTIGFVQASATGFPTTINSQSFVSSSQLTANTSIGTTYSGVLGTASTVYGVSATTNYSVASNIYIDFSSSRTSGSGPSCGISGIEVEVISQ